MDTRKPGKSYVPCPKCGQGVRSEERLKNHMVRCLGTGKWRKKRSA
jgi:hypothetical protein